MIDFSLACQIAIRGRLLTAADVTDLVAATNIIDGPTRPESMPAIVIGEGQTIAEPITLQRLHVRCIHDLHIWHENADLVSVKQIASAAARTLSIRPAIPGAHIADWKVQGVRYLRDPGKASHAVLTVEALLQEAVR